MSGSAEPSGILRARSRVVKRATALLVTCGAIAVPAPAQASSGSPHSLVPKCAWVGSTLVTKTIREPVRALAPSWATSTAPVLTCAYVERVPLLQFANAPIVSIRFAESQGLPRPPRSQAVRGLGHCAGHAPCPGKSAAWLSVNYVTKQAIYRFRYISSVDLRVRDGLNSIEIAAVTPNGPMPVSNEVSRVEALARSLLSRFAVR
jgi:hypothetical protein